MIINFYDIYLNYLSYGYLALSHFHAYLIPLTNAYFKEINCFFMCGD